jgi:hypothetical protein
MLGISNNYVASTLRKDFQVFRISDTPSRLYKCNFFIK